MTLKTKDKILLSAQKLIGENGYTNTKVIDITKDAGIAKGSFYTYFQTKEDVYVELLENMYNSFQKTFDEIQYKGNLKEDVEEFVENVYYSVMLDKNSTKIISSMFISVELSERIIAIRNKLMKGAENHLKQLFKSNKDEINADAVKRLEILAPAFEKFIRVYVVGTLLIDGGCSTFNSERKDLSEDEIRINKIFIGEAIYKALKK